MNSLNMMDFNDPLYLHPLDTPRTNLVFSQQLLIGSDKNMVVGTELLPFLTSQEQLRLIDGTTKKLEPHSPFYPDGSGAILWY